LLNGKNCGQVCPQTVCRSWRFACPTPCSKRVRMGFDPQEPPGTGRWRKRWTGRFSRAVSIFYDGKTEWRYRRSQLLYSDSPRRGALLTDCRSPARDSRPAARHPAGGGLLTICCGLLFRKVREW